MVTVKQKFLNVVSSAISEDPISHQLSLDLKVLAQAFQQAHWQVSILPDGGPPDPGAKGGSHDR